MKNFLSIGCGKGIGLATAKRFAREGFRTTLTARTDSTLGAMVQALRDKTFNAESAVLDASNIQAVSKLVREMDDNIGIDVLHYNAAALRADTIASQTTDSFMPDLAVNIGGALAAIQAVLPGMAKRGGGTILLTSGGFAYHPSPEYLSLSIGKAGLRALVQALYAPCRAQNIHLAMVTVEGHVDHTTTIPANAAEHFWQLHSQAPGSWTSEAYHCW
ncbi:short-chain dehydrogenase/reductase SDR [Pseudomonas sp. Ag1]|uniref:SDR family NAD(P)-dependent oxidoreductase n=1 Tax=Pseudomonas sp. Ag1 TaxID=1197727 RepID=UPI000272C8A2|nr:SDR family NAD(P)-dependent oxidoreductase [Pseudomonas sp. Ag1]EJF69752.1 short-chain dehydrogenase/reductase SDR [Pseudomonas sp. Ag1]